MVGADIEKAYAEAAKGRQRDHGGTAPGKPKNTCGTSATSVGAKAREGAAKQVGVSPRSITSAKKVINDGCPELQQAVRDGVVPVRTAEDFVRAVPKADTQKSIVIGALMEEDPAAQLKQHASRRATTTEATERQPAARIKSALSALDDLEQRLEPTVASYNFRRKHGTIGQTPAIGWAGG
jgi:hypothetical protein